MRGNIKPKGDFKKRLQSALTKESCLPTREDKSYECDLLCPNCVLSLTNRKQPDVLIQHCLDNNYINKAEALEITLDIK